MSNMLRESSTDLRNIFKRSVAYREVAEEASVYSCYSYQERKIHWILYINRRVGNTNFLEISRHSRMARTASPSPVTSSLPFNVALTSYDKRGASGDSTGLSGILSEESVCSLKPYTVIITLHHRPHRSFIMTPDPAAVMTRANKRRATLTPSYPQVTLMKEK
ncbi:hypothetical protein SK128_010702, partial [Halocaridina rubra]